MLNDFGVTWGLFVGSPLIFGCMHLTLLILGERSGLLPLTLCMLWEYFCTMFLLGVRSDCHSVVVDS